MPLFVLSLYRGTTNVPQAAKTVTAHLSSYVPETFPEVTWLEPTEPQWTTGRSRYGSWCQSRLKILDGSRIPSEKMIGDLIIHNILCVVLEGLGRWTVRDDISRGRRGSGTHAFRYMLKGDLLDVQELRLLKFALEQHEQPGPCRVLMGQYSSRLFGWS